MNSNELRKKFLEFFRENGHTIVPSSSLIPTDSSVLFTTAGMQQFKPYYLGEVSPYGKNVASSQKCFRTSDIEEVGDESHLTFFEMLGNFSFGGYFKEEAIKLAKEFLDELKVKIDYVTVFEGDMEIPRDEESAKIWGKLGFSEEKGNLRFENKKENFWGPTGDEGPCGPTTEIYSGGIEIWNIVFNQYYSKNGKLEPLEVSGIDTGMGLERLARVSQNVDTIFETDLFSPIIQKIGELSGKKYFENEKAFRIIADHVKSSVFLASEGVVLSNIERGYILRRLLRRAIRYGKILRMPDDFIAPLIKITAGIYKDVYAELVEKETEVVSIVRQEEEKFEETLEQGLRELNKLFPVGGVERITSGNEIKAINRVDAEKAFFIYQTYGFPLEMIQEELAQRALFVDEKEFKKELEKHQELSRTASAGMFKGGLADTSIETTKLHTAAHLMLAGLRKVLGDNVIQKGSNITSERLRFDFSYKEKMAPDQLKQVEDFVNEAIEKKLPVKFEEMSLDEAKKINAMGVFESKYGEKVKVYIIGEGKDIISKEICGGPHVNNTSELGKFKIIKEESSSAGVRRIKAILF